MLLGSVLTVLPSEAGHRRVSLVLVIYQWILLVAVVSHRWQDGFHWFQFGFGYLSVASIYPPTRASRGAPLLFSLPFGGGGGVSRKVNT